MLTGGNNLNAQYCNVNSQTPVTPLPSSFTSSPGPFTLRIYIHAISDPIHNLPSVTVSQIYTSVNILQQAFQSCGICFSLKGYDFISVNQSLYYDAIVGGWNSLVTMDNQYHVPDCINIYIAPDILSSSNVSGGNAIGIPGTAFVVGGTFTHYFNNQAITSSVISRSLAIAHEMGHCLGLHHTNHGSGTDGIPGGCPELVDGSNATICGDYVSDTPADPIQLWDCSDASCNFVSTCLVDNNTQLPIVDANGQQYSPDIHNIMAYTQVDCMTGFTTGQCSRCLNYIGNSSILQQCLVPNDLYVQNTSFTSGTHFYTTLNTITAGSNVTAPPYGPVKTTSAQTEFKSGAYISLMPGFIAEPTSDYYFLAETGNLCDPITQTNDARMANSTTYHPFLNTTKWISSLFFLHGFFNDSIQYTNIDTIFIGNTYRMYSDYRFYLPGVYNDSSFGTGLHAYYFLREDALSKKVYLLNPTRTAENILYDFSLNVGDTFPVIPPTNIPFYLVNIDSVLINADYRKRFTFESTVPAGVFTTIWIEGIGNITNILGSYTPTTASNLTVCAYENSIVVLDQTQSNFLYPPVSYDCSFLLTGYNDISQTVFEKMDILPNPFNERVSINITLHRPQKISVKLYDMMGNLIRSYADADKPVTGNLSYDFNATNLSQGIYICIMQGEYNTLVEKIIKN